MMVDSNQTNSRDLGDIGVSNEVFETIAVACTRKISGVIGMETADGLVDSLSKVWGRGDTPKGVKVITGDEDVTIDMTVILEEGKAIPHITGTIQREIKTVIEEMTGHAVKEVNILVVDVQPRDSGTQVIAPEEENEE